ncbi:chromosome segregation protein SMC [Micrococcales bacterium 31B]|nr:chromosome segregation protein SMC [Micrococcales bacterium 31B]
MYLKTLTLRGFKSFASATTLHFEPGITAVVGPNGSGKSNVVDALAWVMGEQGAKSLRGGKMEDVIFAGTSGRAPLGRAEVALTIDNSDGVLPIDYTEVTISRTMFRGGSSEYAINGSQVRLLDVQELLSDSGLGKEMHVIVGQGRLDAILQATPEERRGFIEEAAGVLKHRRRREKAVRKLDSMQGNWHRLNDLAGEMRRQLGPLSRQAAAAQRAMRVQAEVRDAKARLLADDLAQASARLQQSQADDSALQRRLAAAEARHATLSADLAAAESVQRGASPRAARATATFHALDALAERLRGTQNVATERARLLHSRQATLPQRLERDPAVLEANLERAQAEAAAATVELETLLSRLAQVSAEREAAEAAHRAEDKRVSAMQRAEADRRERVAQLAGKVAARTSRVEATEAEIERLGSIVADAEQRAAAASADFERLRAEVEQVAPQDASREAAYETAALELETLSAQIEQLGREERACHADTATLAARKAALERSLARKDAAQVVLDAAERARSGRGDATLAGVLGPLAQFARVEPGYETAVAAALANYANAIVVESPETAAAAIGHAREHEQGQVSMLLAGPEGSDAACLPGTDPTAPAIPDLPATPDLPGATAALAVVTIAPALAQTLAALLADVVIVDDVLSAARVVREHPTLTVVTLDGALLSVRSAQGGSLSAPTLLEIAAEVDQADRELQRAHTAEIAVQERLATLTQRHKEQQVDVNNALDELRQHDAEHAERSRVLAEGGAVARAAQAEAERATTRLGQAREAHAREVAQCVEAEAAHAAAVETAAAESLGDIEDDRHVLAERASGARAAETEARLALRTAEERARSTEQRVGAMRNTLRQEMLLRNAAAAQAERTARQIVTAERVAGAAAEVLDALRLSLAAAEGERAEALAEQTAADAYVSTLRDEHRGLSEEISQLSSVAHRDELARAELRMRFAQLEEHAHSQFGVGADALVDEFGPHLPVPSTDPDATPNEARPYVRAEQEARLQRAERDLARIGTVNPLALEEFTAMEERHQYLTGQLEDLQKSRLDLEEIIAEIDRQVQEVFAAAFADTAREFVGVFERLFPGGAGSLILTDPENMLTTGIEVEARPAGKRVKRLSLLSGGERSLAAVAILVAIFKARPSPFYVMDEVEAALDDVNLGRLIGIFKELQESSQLIVITHQKRTMEVADALYGVTMQRDGISAVISQRIASRAEAEQ